MDANEATRYLALLGQPPRSPSLGALTDLVTAHLGRVPFENVSKLIQHGRGDEPAIVSLDRFLDGIETGRLGGTCYACASHFNALLGHLGYEVALCGAAMSLPDVHVVNVVRVAGREYHVDVGYGAPLFAPLPLDGDAALTVSRGNESFVLHPRDGEGRYRLDHRRDGAVIHGYVVNPAPRTRDDFAAVVAHSFRPESEFLNCLRIVRHRPDRSVSVRDLRIDVWDGGQRRTRRAGDAAELFAAVEELLGIPRGLTAEAWAVLVDR